MRQADLSEPESSGGGELLAGHSALLAARDHFERMGAQAKLAEAEQRIAVLTGANTASGSPRPQTPITRATRLVAIPRRRPRGSAELAQRSKWAFETFGIITANKQLLHLLEDVAKLARSSSPRWGSSGRTPRPIPA